MQAVKLVIKWNRYCFSFQFKQYFVLNWTIIEWRPWKKMTQIGWGKKVPIQGCTYLLQSGTTKAAWWKQSGKYYKVWPLMSNSQLYQIGWSHKKCSTQFWFCTVPKLVNSALVSLWARRDCVQFKIPRGLSRAVASISHSFDTQALPNLLWDVSRVNAEIKEILSCFTWTLGSGMKVTIRHWLPHRGKLWTHIDFENVFVAFYVSLCNSSCCAEPFNLLDEGKE